MNGYDTVFANANDEELEFDVMFDQEDSLIDTIIGCNESGDPLTGGEECPAATAEERSCDDCNPDYEKDVDADDSKDAPKDAEGTVGYEFEEKPEVKGEVDDQTKPEAEKPEAEEEYQDNKDDSDKGVEDTVTGTIENEKDVLEAYFAEMEEELGYKETETEEERLTDAPEVTPEDIEDTAKEVAKGNKAEDAEDVVDNSDKGVEDTVTGTIENEKDVLEAYFKEAEDTLNGQDTNPEVNAKERSCDDCNPDYEKDVDAKDSKDAPKDAEGTEGYDVEKEPEVKNKDDQTNVDPKDVKIEEEVDYDITIPDNAEGTVGYDFEVNPEVGSKDDDSIVKADEVKIDEEVEVDYDIPADGATKTVPEVEPTSTEPECGDGSCAPATEPIEDKCCEDVDYDFTESAKSDGVDNDVEKLEDPEDDLNDAVLDDVESKENKPSLDYDISDEDLIDTVLKN